MTWLAELAEKARSVLPPPTWDYVETGAGEGVSAAEAVAEGAARTGTLHVVSSNACRRFAELSGTGPWSLQAYLPPDRESIRPVLEAAREAGATAVVLTVDTPVPGSKLRPAAADWEGTPAAGRLRLRAGPRDLAVRRGPETL